MRPPHNRFPVLASLALALVALLATACDDEFSASCTECFNGIPVGVTASPAACTEFGEFFGCETVVLINEGECPPIDSGLPLVVCEATNCSSDVACPQAEVE